MRYASAEFKKLLTENSTLLVKATIKFASGKTLSLDGTDFFSMGFEEATSSDNTFDIGAAIIGQLTCSLNDTESKFDEYDFDGAVIRPYVGKQLSDGTTEWIKMGVFTSDAHDTYSGTIDLTCLDNMSKFEKTVDTSVLSYPMTLNALVNKACTVCDVDFPQVTFDNGTYTLSAAPDLDNCTWLDVVGYACQVSCNYAKCDQNGDLVIQWYGTDAFEGEAWLDDEYLDDGSPKYASGDTADGGTFDNYGNTPIYDGGTIENEAEYAIITQYSSLDLKTDDVVITGIRATAQNEVTEDSTQGEDGETALEGSEVYILLLESNPLILYGQAATVAAMVGKKTIGMTFRPFSCAAMSDPTIEAGDSVLLRGKRGNIYRSYLTSAKLTVNSSEEFACSAESASRNSAKAAGITTNAYVAARKETERELSTRDKAIERLGDDLENATGLYSTTETQSDGSKIYYLHDKKELGSSKIVYKVTADALGVSTDGGKTFATGLSANGDAILNRIYAIGLNADYINAGTIKGRTISGGTITGSNFYVTNSSGTTVAKFGASSGSTTGIMVLSPYDNKTFLPLSWHAFQEKYAGSFSGKSFSYYFSGSSDVEKTDSFTFSLSGKSGSTGKIEIEYQTFVSSMEYLYLNASQKGSASMTSHVITHCTVSGSSSFNFDIRDYSDSTSATSDPSNYVNLAFSIGSGSTNIINKSVYTVPKFSDVTVTVTVTCYSRLYMSYGSLDGSKSSITTTIWNPFISISQVA